MGGVVMGRPGIIRLVFIAILFFPALLNARVSTYRVNSKGQIQKTQDEVLPLLTQKNIFSEVLPVRVKIKKFFIIKTKEKL